MCKSHCSGLGSIPGKGKRKKNNVLIDKLGIAVSSCNPRIWKAEARGCPEFQASLGKYRIICGDSISYCLKETKQNNNIS